MNIRILELSEKYLESLKSHIMESRLMDEDNPLSDYEVVITDVCNIAHQKDCVVLTLIDMGYPKTVTIWTKDYSVIIIY